MTDDAQSPVPPSDPPPRERIVYRNDDEFKKAMDKAVDRISDKSPFAAVGWILWIGLLGFLAALFATDWWTSIDLRRGLIPGVDLVKPVGIIIAVWIALHFIWARTRHPRIVARRQCLECGRSLLKVPVDEQGDGVCPHCEREYNLGEYRSPAENCGDGFQGYLDAEHFDKTMETVGEQIRAAEGLSFESNAQGWLWILLGVSFFIAIITGWEIFDLLPWDGPYHGVWFVGLLLWGWWYATRLKTLIPGIIERRRCFWCGYSLLQMPTDERGGGRCPECGESFVLAQYERPEETSDDAVDGEDD